MYVLCVSNPALAAKSNKPLLTCSTVCRWWCTWLFRHRHKPIHRTRLRLLYTLFIATHYTVVQKNFSSYSFYCSSYKHWPISIIFYKPYKLTECTTQQFHRWNSHKQFIGYWADKLIAYGHGCKQALSLYLTDSPKNSEALSFKRPTANGDIKAINRRWRVRH